MPTRPTLTAADVATAVRTHFGAERDGLGPEWAALDEFSLGTGGRGLQRADLFLIRAWGGRPLGHERIAVEIKVSRSDLLHELAHPEKAAAFMAVSHRFYLAVPKGLLRPTDQIPAEWGVLEALKSSCRKTKVAPRRENPDPLPEAAVVEAFRRAGRAETRIRGASDADPARIPQLAKALDSAQAAEQRAKQSAGRDRRRLHDFLAAVAQAGGWFCTCGAPLKKPIEMNPYRGHEHADGTECARDRYSRAQPDLGRLAAALGIAPEDPATADRWSLLSHGTPHEALERLRGDLASIQDMDAETRTETIQKMLADINTALDPSASSQAA